MCSAGRTVLHHASMSGSAECIRLICAHSSPPNINALDVDGMSALMYACANGHADCVRELLSHAANVSLRDREGRMTTHHAAASNSDEIMRFLAAAAAEQGTTTMIFDVADLSGATPLCVAVAADNANVARLLLRLGADPAIAMEMANGTCRRYCQKLLAMFFADI